MDTVADGIGSRGPTSKNGHQSGQPVVAGRYQVDLQAPLGTGGMALVYRGRDLRLRRDVALKTLRVEYRSDPDTRARFRREARFMAFLAHRNVVRVEDLCEDGDTSWVILEYVPGQTLKDLVAARGPFSPAATSRILDQIAAALDHLHGRGFVHLDVKPHNVLLTTDGDVKLIDFGLCQRAGASQEMIGGLAFGTAAYLAPEQARGDSVEPATDVYALGCLVYELLTGSPPFVATGSTEVKNDVIRAHLEREPAPPSRARPDLDLPGWIDDVVLWALAKQPADRYPDVTTFARLFREGVAEDAAVDLTSTRPVSPLVEPTPEPATTSHPESPTPSVAGRLTGGAYRLGGRLARRTRRLSNLLWRLTIMLLLGNLILATLLVIDRGSLSALYDPTPILRPGGSASVAVADLRVRSSPGLSAPTITVLAPDTTLDLTDSPTPADGETWWPVRLTLDGETITGYVWAGGIKAEGRLKRLDEIVDEIRDRLS
jgi:serine/threonine-protein kinase